MKVGGTAPPVRYTENGTVTASTVSSFPFSHWGKAVHVTAPSGAVPYASLPRGLLGASSPHRDRPHLTDTPAARPLLAHGSAGGGTATAASGTKTIK